MADQRTDDDVDERASAALDALRRAGDELGAPPPAWSSGGAVRAAMERLDAELAHRWPDGPQASTVVAGALVLVVVVLGGAWLALRAPAAGGAVGAGGAPVTLPFTTTVDPAPPSGAGGASGTAGTGTGTSVPGPGATVAELVVHAAGAVAMPGVHQVPTGARVADVLAAAGGPTADADLDRVNLAAPVADGERLYVPRTGEGTVPPVLAGQGAGGSTSGGEPSAGGTSGTGGAGGPAGGAGPVDLNTATADQLDALPGVGPATAQAILAHRDRRGPFTTVEQLLEVRGIGPAKLEALRDLVTVG